MSKKKLGLLSLLLLVPVSILLATSYGNQTYTNAAVSNNTKLTLKSPTDGATVTIPASAKITFCDSSGTKLNPQPPYSMNPNQGTAGSEIVITLEPPHTFGPHHQVKVSTINTSGTAAAPTPKFTKN